ncbi:pitrilysin family protein [Carboxylicivirga sp. M1479]|uniref:M16 family metallopeptidase n=1 Tax=Carboxylicivirga sp. M1479 TaxID=2594476 RepID=UPI001178AE2F|nr:M16 family metallopeptidase [Carboxylicivirga sp. M1479]TRX71128.1 insulinase family protein [Carboxylicivirga sp. M1479]
MRQKELTFYWLIVLLCMPIINRAEELPGKLEHYKLDNELTVILYEDPEATNVFGSVTVKAGSYHEPIQSTGLAHYLEHVLFKGTEELGTTNWEAEKVFYNQIISLFEEMRESEEPERKKEISKEINELSLKAGEYTINNEFSNLVQSIGGTGLNAGTGYDQTSYYNSFPSYNVERWLELYSARFQNPVFRGFQAELENVYEEKNMYADDPFSALMDELSAAVYGEEHPYGRSIIGYTDHLKNPSLKDVIDFYNTQYVPGNMALVLSGDIDIEAVKPLIEKSFGTWQTKEVPQDKVYQQKSFDGKVKKNVRMTPFPQAFWIYEGIKVGDEDEVALDLLCEILSNNNQTGVLDKYVLDGDIQYVNVGADTRKYGGSINISAVPTFDLNTYKFTSVNVIHKIIEKELNKMIDGNVSDWLLNAVKTNQINEYKLALESPQIIGLICSKAFVNNKSINEFLDYPEKVKSISKEDVIRVAKKYLGDDYLAFYSMEGSPAKGEVIKKPKLEPIVPATGKSSVFAQSFKNIPLNEVKSSFVDFQNDIKTSDLAPGVKLFYTPNKANDVFSMTIKFGAGSRDIPAIGLASSLMNSAGVMAQFEAHQIKKEFSSLGCVYRFYNDANYTYVILTGDENNLEDACRLLSKLYIIPELDEKQMSRLIGGTIGSRSIEKKDKDSQVEALRNYLLYGENSPMLERLSSDEIKAFTLSSLAAEFTKATQFETSVHFVGTTPFDELKSRLVSSLAFPSDLKKSTSPNVIPFSEHADKTIYFVHNKEASQSDIYLYIRSNDYQLKQEPYIEAFNQYFSGGFNGIVAQELRELRSFAYTANANYISLPIQSSPTALVGYIGTQSDNTKNALNEYLKLINDMPLKPERIDNIKNYLVQKSGSGKPSFRYLSQNIEQWQKRGYEEDPGLIYKPVYEEMSFDDIVAFYNENVKGLPISIAIVGNKNEVDIKSLSEFGKVKSIRMNQIFTD